MTTGTIHIDLHALIDQLQHVKTEAESQISALQELLKNVEPIVDVAQHKAMLDVREASLDEREDAIEDREHASTNKKKK